MKGKTIYEILREAYRKDPRFLEKLLKKRYGYAGTLIWYCLKTSASMPIQKEVDLKRASYMFEKCFGVNLFTALNGVREKKMDPVILKNFSDFVNDAPMIDYIIAMSAPLKKKMLAEVL